MLSEYNWGNYKCTKCGKTSYSNPTAANVKAGYKCTICFSKDKI